MYLYNNIPGTFHRIGNRFNRFFDFNHFLGRNALEEPWMVSKQHRIKNGKKYFKMDLTLPGFSKKDIKVSISQNTLFVKIPKDTQIHNEDLVKKESMLNLGQYSYNLPDYLDQDGITARLRDGVLKIRIPYKAGYQKPEVIKVGVN